LEYGGNRSIRFKPEPDPDTPAIRHCIAIALTWHRRKK
ncbi:MAG: DUF1801 domain-containing protein, partial [Alphaproteobacteria bacterium]|nr:DUF1801 domain-containing protein [Alphaproteobacteria bacterium]